jgi:hypothetical protein
MQFWEPPRMIHTCPLSYCVCMLATSMATVQLGSQKIENFCTRRFARQTRCQKKAPIKEQTRTTMPFTDQQPQRTGMLRHAAYAREL